MRKASYFSPVELEMFNSQKPIFNDAQMKIINRKTPKSEVEIKTDKNGHKYKSVKAAYVKALVSLVTGGNYSFEINNRELSHSTREVFIEGRLTIETNSGSMVREQLGQHYLNTKTDVNDNRTTTHASDIGNGYKAAASDAFKKCASEFGFCWDIYGQEHAENNTLKQPEKDHSGLKKLERLSYFLNKVNSADKIELIYNTFLDTATETSDSKNLLQLHMNRVLKKP